MRVTVTGATGNIGLASVRTLVRAGHEVRAFVRRPEEFGRLSPETRVEVAEGDILDRAAVAAALDGADAVVHCVDFPPSQFALNWDAVRHALEALRPGGWFIFPGNSWVYGPAEKDARVAPGHPKNSPSRLGAVKADMEKAVTAEGGTVVHLPEVYGPGVGRGRLHDAFRQALIGKTVRFPGDLDRPHEFLYISDAARALVAPLGRAQARGADYTAPGYSTTTPREFLTLAFRAAGQSPRVRSISISWLKRIALLQPEQRLMRDLSYLLESPVMFDGTRIRRELGWMPEVDYANGVRRTVKWMRQPRSEHPMSADQGERNIEQPTADDDFPS
jgi:nucleoside-diphosphate-sugar epimerase